MLLIFVVLQPLLAGGLDPLSLGKPVPAPLESLVVNVFAFLTAAAALLSRSALLKVRALKASLGALGGLTLLGVLQLLPLPDGVLSRIASVNLQIYHETDRILRPLAPALVPAPRISIAPGQTVAILLRLCACLALLLASASLSRTRARRRVLIGTVLLAGVAGATLLALATGLPFRGPEPVATAFLLGIALSVAFGSVRAEVLTGPERAMDSADVAERLERRLLPLLIRVAAWLVIAAGLALSRAWPVVAGAAGATLVLLAIVTRRGGSRPGRTAVGAAAALLIAFSLGAGSAPASDESSLAFAQKMLTWRTDIAAWKQFPIFGSGFGSFADAFRRVQPREIQGLVDRGGSGMLEVLVTGGACGLGLAVFALASLLVAQIRAFRSQRHREEGAIALGAFGATLFFLLANLAESAFPPLIELPLLATVVGSGWAASQARGAQAL